MKYMLLIYTDENFWANRPEAERQSVYAEYRDLIAELKSKGKYLFGDQLQPSTTARSVRVREGRQITTDGPFAETREQVGGFFMIEADDLEEAKQIAGRIPSARSGAIEVRPVVPATASASAT